MVKIWGYDEGLCNFVGVGHSGAITKIIFSPDQKSMLSVGDEGAIFIWRTPEEVVNARADNELPTVNKPQELGQEKSQTQSVQNHKSVKSGTGKSSTKK